MNMFMQNYIINEGSSLVKGGRIVVEESLMSKAWHLSISKLEVGDAKPPLNFNVGK